MSADALTRLEGLHRGFRDRFLSYEELTAQVRAWADAFPALVRLRSICTTPSARELWFLEIGPDPDRIRPAAWVDGNMHASEICGSSVALAIAEDVLRLHLAPSADHHGLPPHVVDTLREVLLYVLPRMSPDGAEAVLTSGRYVRSVPRNTRPDRGRAFWVSEDVDGDGLALLMRKEDPTGEFVESKDFPGLLLQRRLEDTPPFYKVYGEGRIEGFDGHTVPSPYFLSDNEPDLNRNFPYHWAPEPDQVGAGRFPLSEPESRAVVELTTAHPNIFAWLNLHTFGGCFIRPLGDKPDVKMNQDELALWREIGAFSEKLTSYPMVSGFEEFTYEPEKALHGDLTDYAYRQRGCVAYVCELWDLFKQVGLERKKRFVDNYVHLTQDDMLKLARWDAAHNEGRAMRPWKRFTHPQLGPVEIGGIDPRVGFSNPPYEMLPGICAAQAAAYLRVAAMAPRVAARARTTALGDGTTRVDVDFTNLGYLSTMVLPSAKDLPWNEPPYATVTAHGGCQLATPSEAKREIGHLDGWGRGMFDGTGALYFMRSRGTTASKTMSWVVRGKGVLEVRVESCRMGATTIRVEVG